MELPSTKPYLLRALWEWCVDNGFTPHISVQVDASTMVPREFVRDGQIVLNLGPEATNKLQMGNDWIEFQARFGGVARQLSIPVAQVMAIYARENGAGMAFELIQGEDLPQGNVIQFAEAETDEPETPPPPPKGRPKLQRVK